jgi:soluble lytic murein transglycosylase-like protein
MIFMLMTLSPTLLGNYPIHKTRTIRLEAIVAKSANSESILQNLEISEAETNSVDIADKTADHQDEKEPDEESLPPYHSIILQAADHHGVDPALIRAIIMAESSYNPNAVSRSGAKGLMQLMPRTARALGVKDILNPENNINGGTKYLRQMLDRFNGDVKLALAAYNAGSRYVKKYKDIPPFKETQTYVKKVLNYYKAYRKEMG